MKNLLRIALRQKAIYLPNVPEKLAHTPLSEQTSRFVADLGQLGFEVDEPLLHALNHAEATTLADVMEVFRDVMGVNKNWTPLVKGWDVPTGETRFDHVVTFFVNIFGGIGTTLPCGHLIPENTFPLERYNGCPFCGTPFEFGKIEVMGQASKKKRLSLWTTKEVSQFYKNLLLSKTPLDATQVDSLKILLTEPDLPIPKVSVGMKETLMLMIDTKIEAKQASSAQELFATPTDILRYLWYKHTGFLQVVAPKTILKRKTKNAAHFRGEDKQKEARQDAKQVLKLHYGREMCFIVASWLNGLKDEVEKSCEMMHSKREIWVRFFRALRLSEYSKRPGFEKLASLLDTFYNERYTVWQGEVNAYYLQKNKLALKLLQERPGIFARSLFANMLKFGSQATLEAFETIAHKVPARLLFTLNMYAPYYFNPAMGRTVKPLGGVSKFVPSNAQLKKYTPALLEKMQNALEEVCLNVILDRFSKIKTDHKTIYIDPVLFYMPVPIGDRSENVQDMPSALIGTRFAVEGNKIRLFMQWGEGLPAQHLDMDLSCRIAYEAKEEYCSYSRLVVNGCKHSGDIRSIPDKIGTAEYIEIDIDALKKAGAKYVTFTCNAYSNGAITPNLVLGWMNSKYPMHISERTGVAYDPSCVQHQVRVTQKLTKGLIFGVLDVEAKEVIWLEMPFQGQVVQQFDARGVRGMLAKLNSKLSVGNLLTLKAKAQNLKVVKKPEADEVYDTKWASDVAQITSLLID